MAVEMEFKEEENKKLEEIVRQKQNEMEEMESTAEENIKSFSNLLDKYQSVQQKLEEKEQNLQIFNCKKIGQIGSLSDVPVQLILRRNINNQFIVELEYPNIRITISAEDIVCLLYTSDAADEEDSVDLGCSRI
eukprot:TRINITY_DN19100_c0_g1_i1.p1 TRINITY_DN19100_c0_g1~~TRINITY_DN19100_c0_g1_i1.p1  ORF type:complete len:134 (-),score=36.32 TRINITY_DN19100_c0_g1_i1:88-489(-)